MGWSELIGRQLDEYEIVQEIARGGMSRVYYARDLTATRDVAIKVMLLGSEGNDSTFARRFQHEAQAVERLDHPNIVKVFATGQTDEFVYMVMQLVTGGTFRDRLKRGQVMPVPEACAYIEQMARALHHAHTHHVIHRDVKPANMLIDQNDAHHLLLADFGIAKIIGQKGVTKTGTAVGTPEYMAPEQAKGEEIDPRADIYGLACVLYEALAGRPPFQGPTALSICYQHVHTRPAYIRGFNPEVPRQLALVVEQALAKNPRDRYATADDFANALYAFTEPKGPVIRRSMSAPITPPGLDLRATTGAGLSGSAPPSGPVPALPFGGHSEGQSPPNLTGRDPAANSGVSVIPPFDSQGNALPFTTSPALDFSALSARPPLTPSPMEDDATTRPTQEIVPIMSPSRPRHTRPVVPPGVRLRSATITSPRPGADDPAALPTAQLPISDATPVLSGKRSGTIEIEPRRRPLLILVAVAIAVSLITLLLITRLNGASTPTAQHSPTATVAPTATTVPTVAPTGTRPAATVTPTTNVAAKYVVLVTTTLSPDTTCVATHNVNHFTAESIVYYNFCLAPGTPPGTISVVGYHDGTILTPSPKAQVSNTSGSPEGYWLYYTYGLSAGSYTINAQWNGQTGRTITFTVG